MGDMNRMSVNTHVQEVKFNNWRHGLLDIGRRNRMINFRKTKRTTLKLVNPSFADLYRRIAVSEETITFKRRVDTGSDVKLAGLFFMLDKVNAPVELSVGEIGSDIPTEEMGITLKNLRAKARLSREEQGINTLYLCFGFLEWRQKPSDPPMQEKAEAPSNKLPSAFQRLVFSVPSASLSPEDKWKSHKYPPP